MAATKPNNPGNFKKGDPRIKRGPGGGPRKPVKTAIPVLRQFFAILDQFNYAYSSLMFSRDALCRWRSGKRSPYLVDFWEAAHQLGYDIVLVPRPRQGDTLATPQAADRTHSGGGTGGPTHARAA